MNCIGLNKYLLTYCTLLTYSTRGPWWSEKCQILEGKVHDRYRIVWQETYSICHLHFFIYFIVVVAKFLYLIVVVAKFSFIYFIVVVAKFLYLIVVVIKFLNLIVVVAKFLYLIVVVAKFFLYTLWWYRGSC